MNWGFILQYPWGKEYGFIYISQRSTWFWQQTANKQKFSLKIFIDHQHERQSHCYSTTSKPKEYSRKPRKSSVVSQIKRISTILSYDDEEVKKSGTVLYKLQYNKFTIIWKTKQKPVCLFVFPPPVAIPKCFSFFLLLSKAR